MGGKRKLAPPKVVLAAAAKRQASGSATKRTAPGPRRQDAPSQPPQPATADTKAARAAQAAEAAGLPNECVAAAYDTLSIPLWAPDRQKPPLPPAALQPPTASEREHLEAEAAEAARVWLEDGGEAGAF